VVLATSFLVGFLFGLILDSEDGGDIFLRNVGLFPNYSQKKSIIIIMLIFDYHVCYTVKVKISLLEAMEAHRVARG
jgi:hypothetical protein